MPSQTDQFARIRSDPAVFDEILSRRPAVAAILKRPPGVRLLPSEAAASRLRRPPADARTPAGTPAAVSAMMTEAIVVRDGRPTLLIRNDTFEIPQLDAWKARILPYKSRINGATRSVGRLEVLNSGMPYFGTAWMITPTIAVTNRHVALEFGSRKGKEFAIRSNPIGLRFVPRIDFKEEYVPVNPYEVSIQRILYISELDDAAPDLAFVELAPTNGRALPPPIKLYDGKPSPGQVVVTIGYPAEDPRNDASDQARLFGGVYNVKRMAPGLVLGTVSNTIFSHDCTTLGGSSGSVVLDVETGAALGLHFAGEYLDANYAITSSTLSRYLGRLKRKDAKVATVDPAKSRAPQPERKVAPRDLADRDGYVPDFLGTGALSVPLPRLTSGLAELAVKASPRARGSAKYVLSYTHYSVVMHKDRRMAILVAVNIDGEQTVRIKRTGDEPWALDPRIPAGAQIDNKLYAGNDLDRGHLVRRLDPAWGSSAKLGEQDTFFFTNCTPQHSAFNQHLWLSLEDYLLDNAASRGFKANVFTGPVFDAKDRPYRDVLLPGAYWKVATMVRDEDGSLSATAYIVSQADLITDLEFAFGEFKTYQVSVARIESLTGLDFGSLKDHDPLAGIEGLGVNEIIEPADIRL